MWVFFLIVMFLVGKQQENTLREISIEPECYEKRYFIKTNEFENYQVKEVDCLPKTK